jgi:hypothetical protein
MLSFEIPSEEFKLSIYNENADIGGGKTTKEDIDKIIEYPNEENITLMGLNQDMLEYFVEHYGKQFKRIRFFKNKRITDLSPLSRLPQLEYISFFANQGVTKLWNMSNNTKLETLIVLDFSKLKTFENIETAPVLKNFYRGDAVWTTAELDSFEPLRKSSIENLGFMFQKIEDKNIEPIIAMKNLKKLECHPSTFTKEKCVEFSIRRPDVSGTISKAYIDWGDDYIMVVGKYGRLIKKPVEEKRIRSIEKKWNEIKNRLLNDSVSNDYN